MVYSVFLNNEDISLVRSLLLRHRDLAIVKIRFYEMLDRNGEYHSSLEGYKKLLSRYNSLLSRLPNEKAVV